MYKPCLCFSISSTQGGNQTQWQHPELAVIYQRSSIKFQHPYYPSSTYLISLRLRALQREIQCKMELVTDDERFPGPFSSVHVMWLFLLYSGLATNRDCNEDIWGVQTAPKSQQITITHNDDGNSTQYVPQGSHQQSGYKWSTRHTSGWWAQCASSGWPICVMGPSCVWSVSWRPHTSIHVCVQYTKMSLHSVDISRYSQLN